ncbi:hypothetical protein DPMN_138136 [Dreissena polymorpha]|uniref:Uncharacterized protein n=2 Tax=Dreissena polymorpha TaxID=45954 RepID=A0A9D4G6R2_DREPO|nr:hypothetical protein DPMN_138136 [Dreissena polymorpha]
MSLGNMMEEENETENQENSSEDEADTLCPSHVLEQSIDPGKNNNIPKDYVDSAHRTLPSAKRGVVFKSEPKPDQKSVILIPQADQTDTKAGDYFGGTLYTYNYTRPSGKKYKFQHLLKDIIDGYPAEKMRISEGDELVLIGETFTPDQDHDTVIKTFKSGVNVDGHSRFTIILRRSETKDKKKSWYWYETSAILAPDHGGHRLPDVLQPHCEAVDGKRTRIQQIVYNIPGNSSLYMFIDELGIRAVHTEKDDHSVYVNKIIQQTFTPNRYTSYIALCGKDNKSYVRIDEQRNVCIWEKPTWFEGKHVCDDDSFGTNGYYLVFDRILQKFEMVLTCDNQQKVKTFSGYRLDSGLDSTDDACALRTISYSNHGYDSYLMSTVNNARAQHYDVPQSPVCLSFENLEIEEKDGEEEEEVDDEKKTK